jgi:transcriptional regulator with XRE-family HTH domain
MKVLLGRIMYDKNLSVRQVSIMTGVSKSTISRIVNGQVSPTLDTVEQLAKGLHLKVTDLFKSDIQ